MSRFCSCLQYACGGWEKITPIPDGRTSWSKFEKLTEMNQLAMKNALDAVSSDSDDDDSNSAMNKVFTYYRSCLDENGTLEELQGIIIVCAWDSYGSIAVLSP